MGDCSDEESRCGEKSVSDLRSLFEKKITEANNGRSRSPMPGSRPLSTDNTSNSKSICNLPTPSQDEHLPPFRGRVSTAMPPDRQRDPNFCSKFLIFRQLCSSSIMILVFELRNVLFVNYFIFVKFPPFSYSLYAEF